MADISERDRIRNSPALRIVARVCNEHRNSDLYARNRDVCAAFDEAIAQARAEGAAEAVKPRTHAELKALFPRIAKRIPVDVWEQKTLADQFRWALYQGEHALNLIEFEAGTINTYQQANEAQRETVEKLQGLIGEMLPYVQRAYEYSFPDEETNRRIADEAEAALARKGGA